MSRKVDRFGMMDVIPRGFAGSYDVAWSCHCVGEWPFFTHDLLHAQNEIGLGAIISPLTSSVETIVTCTK